MDRIKDYIIDISRQANIDLVGFTKNWGDERLKEYLYELRGQGNYPPFALENIEDRFDIGKILKDANTIIAIGISYNVEYEHGVEYEFKGKISRSSWGIDYHNVLKNKMEYLVSRMKEKIEFDYKYFVDTGPLIDREVAKKAGLGYYGKNSSIINPEYGSLIFLGYIVTNLDLDPSKELKADCGSCSICIDNCPTRALGENNHIEYRRCISYLSQTKDYIEEELREKMGNNIYGCDLCQSVCPKNKRVKKSKNTEFIPLNTGKFLDIREILEISNKDFNSKYRSHSFSWRGKSIIKRNAIIALGNSRNKRALGLLLEIRDKESNPYNREYISWAIEKLEKGD